MEWMYFSWGFFIGGFVGALLACLMFARKEDDTNE